MTNTTTNRAHFTLATTIDVGEARRIASRASEVLNGRTYFDFRVEWGIGPTYTVFVSYAGRSIDDLVEAQGMALSLLAQAVAQ